jgi:hypothetical protein
MDEFDDRFEPLTESERAAAQTGDDAPKDKGECLMPVPADAPAKSDIPPTLGKPSATWPYRDAAGRLLFEVWRFDPAGKRKIFLPLSLWRDASGRLTWHWKSVPAPRPLYGLDRLAAMPDAPVVVCEGEKTADAAALTFPKSACITSAGRCKAEAKANFEPLAGRRVLIWPDADEAGATYAASVAGILHALGCEVSIIDAVTLASLAPGGGTREPVKGWDAADAVAEWQQDIAALRKATHGLATSFEPEAAKPGPGADDGPLPLFPPLAEAEPYPVDALGKTLSRAASAIAMAAQVPIAMAAQSVLAVASLAASSHADVQLPFGQVRPLSLFFATVAASGDKSTADNEALWPVAKQEKTLREAYADELKEWRIAQAAWSAEKHKIEGDRNSDFNDRKARLSLLGSEPEKPLSPFLVTGDFTIEGLTKNWSNAHAALGVFTAEGGMFTAGHGMNDDNRLKTAAMLASPSNGFVPWMA